MKMAYSTVRILLMIVNAFYLTSAYAAHGSEQTGFQDPCPGGYVNGAGECKGRVERKTVECGDQKIMLHDLGCLNSYGDISQHCSVVPKGLSCPREATSSVPCNEFKICTDFQKSTENIPARGGSDEAEGTAVN